MDALLEALAKLLGVFKDPTQVVLLLVCVAEGWFIWVVRKEDREDKGKVVDALKDVNATLASIRNFLAAHAGKVVE